jgi:hypothetical protein
LYWLLEVAGRAFATLRFICVDYSLYRCKKAAVPRGFF